MNDLLISFSGGRSSAFMCRLVQEHPHFKKLKKTYVFANTGKEREETLHFVNECDKRFGLNLVWVEAVIHPDKGVGTSYKIVNFKTANRTGEPFENMIKKYGIPSINQPHCTRELKQIPIKKYMKSKIGHLEYFTALGMRDDERNRVKYNHSMVKHPIYPLADSLPVNEGFINRWWSKQDFDLDLQQYEGNCDLCYKKSKRKRLTILKKDIDKGSWWSDMEKKYGRGYTFDQRDNLSITELIRQSKEPFREWVSKKSYQKSVFEPSMDIEIACMCGS